MPTERSTAPVVGGATLDDEDQRRFHYVARQASHVPSALAAGWSKPPTSSGGPVVDSKRAALELDAYTRLELDDDPEEDEVHLRTAYLLDEDRIMTPLAQLQQTKTLLTEGQRVAYVGLCRLVSRELVDALLVPDTRARVKAGQAPPPVKEFTAAAESTRNWATKVMGRLYHHMDIDAPEQRMIEQLVEHGVTAADLTPSLVATHTVPNPEFDPSARRDAPEPPAYEDEPSSSPARPAEALTATDDDDDGAPATSSALDVHAEDVPLPDSRPPSPTIVSDAEAGPATLPGVTTSLSSTDREVTLDMRYTVICDLFLSLIADSVYDARSRVLLGRTAEALGLGWADLIRFERRLTEALELQEAVQTRDDGGVIEDCRLRDRKRRYAIVGLAALGGGLVIGLSAGLLAPMIGAGLGAAFTTIGVGGTGTFLTGTGGAAIITTGGVLTGAKVGGSGMVRRTQSVRTFELIPLHNNNRLNCFITVIGFMNGKTDDVRLPFSVLNPVVGDVFSALWEPEMMGETGNALRILTSEILTQVGQQILQATVMTALMSALQWPVLLTKLGYLIDNPWSNALDRSKATGAVLADILIMRHIGVRPVSLIGFSLGARVIFYALEALAKAKAFGIVQDVILLGATVTAPIKTWRAVRGVVAGRLVNGYSRSDWILGYLFRATTGGLSTVAGLRPVEHVPGVENVDLTEIVVGHTSYRTSMPLVLQYLGFKVTADFFDDVEDASTVPEREFLTKEEEIRRQAEREKRRVFGISALLKGKARAQGLPEPATPAVPAPSPGSSTAAGPSPPPADDDDNQLPPRQDHAVFDVEAIRAELAAASTAASATTDNLPSQATLANTPPPRPASAVPGAQSQSASSSTVELRRPPSPPERNETPTPPAYSAPLPPPPLPPRDWPAPPYGFGPPPSSSTISLSFARDDGEIADEPPVERWDPPRSRLPAFPSGGSAGNVWEDPRW